MAEFEIALTSQSFKWDHTPAWWASVFVGSNDDLSETNHAAIGGIGNKPVGAYVGR